MTIAQAIHLASHAEMPEIAPICKHGHTQKKRLGRNGSYYWVCPTCEEAIRKIRDARRRDSQCPRCGDPLRFSEPTPAHRYGEWQCDSCEAKRKQSPRTTAAKKAAYAALCVAGKAKHDYRRAWRNIQRLPAIEREVAL